MNHAYLFEFTETCTAIGVSGAPGGDKDEACALQGIQKYREQLEFAELD